MTNNRQKGKRGERYFKNQLLHIFPNIRRNANEQSQMGGVDLLNTDSFDFECKVGKAYKNKMIRKMLDQIETEGLVQNFKAVLVKPHLEESYVVMPFHDFVEILELMKNEGIIKP